MGNTATTRSQRYCVSSFDTARSVSEETNRNSDTGNGRRFYLFYLIHRTWTVVVADSRFLRMNRRRPNVQDDTDAATVTPSSTMNAESLSTLSSASDTTDAASQYSFCSCSYCRQDDGFSDCTSDLYSFEPRKKMSPNSENAARKMIIVNGNAPEKDWLLEEDYAKEKQRPPIYNPEDYVLALRKWGRKSGAPTNPPGTTPTANSTPPNLYTGTPNGTQDNRTNTLPANSSGSASGTPSLSSMSSVSTSSSSSSISTLNELKKTLNNPSPKVKDYRNPMLTASDEGEMSLRQFSSVSELLTKLRADLRYSFPSFVQEFVGEPWDGITLLLELLRGVQLSQAGGTMQRVPPAVQRRALLDELACLQCLISCCARYNDSVIRLAASPAGLFTLAVAIMSNVNRSRVLALQLLTLACEPPGNGHTPVSESLSTLRLRFGEPVRFRFLVGVLTSAGSHAELLASGLRFINAFMMSAGSSQKRLYVQAELEQAGFDPSVFRKIVPVNTTFSDKALAELDKWKNNIFNIETLASHAEEIERQNESLKEKMKLLERRVQILQEEKGILLSLEQCLKDRCNELQDEVSKSRQIKVNKKITRRASSSKQDDSTPAEDEGISSSERSISPDDDIQREPMVYEVINVQNDTIVINGKKKHETPTSALQISHKNNDHSNDNDEDETTIDEVIEELRNIINDAETEAFEKEKRDKAKYKNQNMQIQMKVDLIEDQLQTTEAEIVPSNLHPQPPRKTKSLIHLFYQNEPQDYECREQEIFFEDDTQLYTSDEDSDSLLSASKCQNIPRIDRQEIINNSNDNRALLNSIMDARERAEQYEQRRRQKAVAKKYNERNQIQNNNDYNRKDLIKVKDANIVKSIKHNSSEGLFIVDGSSPTIIQNGNKSREATKKDLVVLDKIKSKSLDRIDEGLDSMVDIVVTSDYHRLNNQIGCHRKRSVKENKNAIVVVARDAHLTGNGTFKLTQYSSPDTISTTTYYDDKHRVFLPQTSVVASDSDTNGLLSHRLILPSENTINTSNSCSTFSIKRGHTNAGLYSGVQQSKKLISSIPSSDYRSMSMTSKNLSIGSKVMDLPSGLY